MKPIPFWNPLPEYEEIGSDVHTAISRVLSSGLLILGPEVVAFEKAFARFVGCRYGIGVGNGTDAITIGLKALGIGRGDEVITAANTAIPTVAAIVQAGATPKLVDVTPDTLLIDPDKLPRAITKRTRAIIPVHLYGQACDMDGVMEVARAKKLFVLEDCAQAAGATYRSEDSHIRHRETVPTAKRSIEIASSKTPRNDSVRVGSIGDIAAFSFYPTKIIGAYGDGGMITTNNADLAKRARSLRIYGTEGSYNAKIPGGINSRLDELHAAILSVKLKHIKQWIKERQRLARRYADGLKHTPMILPSPLPKVKPFEANVLKLHDSSLDERSKKVKPFSHVFHLYVVRHRERDKLRKYLDKRGIATAIHYPVPIHLMPAYKTLGYTLGSFPIAEAAARTVLSLPLYPGLPDEDQNRIITAIRSYFKLSK